MYGLVFRIHALIGARFEEEKAMKCVICRYGETAPGKVTVSLEHDGATVVIKEVPARVCQTVVRNT